MTRTTEEIVVSWVEHLRSIGGTVDDEWSQRVGLCAVATQSELQINAYSLADLQPGNGTRYLLAVTKLDEMDAIVAGGRYVVSKLEGIRGAAVFSPGLATPDYVAERLGLNISDAVWIAAFLSLALR